MLIGVYRKTIFRNRYTAETEFLLHPLQQYEGAEDGIVLCKGIVGAYDIGMLIQIEGTYDENLKIFSVSSDCIATKTYTHCRYILEYITDELNHEQVDQIIELAENDLFEFIKQPDSLDKIIELLGKSETELKLANKIYKKTLYLAEKSEFDHLLMRYEIPLDCIERMSRKDITLEQLKANPYRFLLENKVDFKLAERFAFNETLAEELSLARIKGIVYECLSRIRKSGHTSCTLDCFSRAVNRRMERVGMYKTPIPKALVYLCITEMPKYCKCHLLDGEIQVYLEHIWMEECLIVKNLKRLSDSPKQFVREYGIEDTEKALGMRYNYGQRKAFHLLRTSGIKILTGPPGSGKTATLNGLIHNFMMNQNGTVRLAATTGMAAKVLSSACGFESETVHKMLNVIPYDDGARGRDLNNPIDADFIIVDEVSMLGVQMLSILLQAVRSGSILLLVGDSDQLLSVEYGNVLHDLINSGRIEVCRLTEVMRQSGSICHNAALINHGFMNLTVDNAFEIVNCRTANEALDALSKRYSETGSQIISPIKRGPLGTVALNKQFGCKTGAALLIYGQREFRRGDKVIMTCTNYQKGYINGDIGYVVDYLERSLIVEFKDKTIPLGDSDIANVELAYAITVHKSQGSEFEYVHIVLPTDACHMMTRRLLYTAVTRAKKKVIIYSVNDSHVIAIRNTNEMQRLTKLATRIQSQD